jgi:hypothetical protein
MILGIRGWQPRKSCCAILHAIFFSDFLRSRPCVSQGGWWAPSTLLEALVRTDHGQDQEAQAEAQRNQQSPPPAAKTIAECNIG